MSTSAKITLWVVIAVVVVGGGIWWFVASQPATSSNPSGSAMQATSSDMGDMNMSSTSATATTTVSSMPQGDSDAAIQQDMTSSNDQMNGFSSDSASMNQGLNDQPVQQAE
jgi:cytoskeletal protein RodZ